MVGGHCSYDLHFTRPHHFPARCAPGQDGGASGAALAHRQGAAGGGEAQSGLSVQERGGRCRGGQQEDDEGGETCRIIIIHMHVAMSSGFRAL